MVEKKNMPTRRRSKKLDHKKAGPFQMMKVIRKRAYKLQLPEGSRIHPTYHVQMLERYWRSVEPSRQLEPPEPEPLDGEENWIVREIVDSRRNNRKKGKPIEYLVLWEHQQQRIFRQVRHDDLQEYGILPHSRTYYCLLFSLYHMFIVFVISY